MLLLELFSENSSRLHGRLSVYYSAAPQTLTEQASNDDIGVESDEDSDNRDDDTIMADSGDGLFNFDSDSEDEDEEENGGLVAYQSSRSLVRTTSELRRIVPGPPQNTDVRGRKIPPQLILQKIERIIHKVSMKLSVELVSAPPCATMPHPEGSSMEIGSCSALNASMSDSDDGGMNKQTSAHRKKKAMHDAFDRLLGLNTKSANPVIRIASGYLGPLMRVVRVATYIVRISFHISTWKDPFLSFWVFVGLLILLFVLIIFPWRNFFLLLVMASVGPQVCTSAVLSPVFVASWLSQHIFFVTTNIEYIPSNVFGEESRRKRVRVA